MSAGWMTRAIFARVGVAVLVAVPTATFSAENTKPQEIVVVGSKVKKAGQKRSLEIGTLKAGSSEVLGKGKPGRARPRKANRQ